MIWVAFAVLTGLVVLSRVLGRRDRRRRLIGLRAQWGQAHDRPRVMTFIAEYHRLQVVEHGADRSLDQRTWDDLHLDAIFALLDRAESTIGQQLLYDRLRTSPMPEDTDQFEALVEHLSNEAAAREDLQLALTALQDRGGYHLCWFGQPGLLEGPWWHVLFPALAATMVIVVSLIPVVPVAFLAAIGLAILHVVVRIATASRVDAILGAFRQIAPLVSAAGACARLDVPGAVATINTLRDEIPRLTRLHRYAGSTSPPSSNGELISVFVEYVNLLLLLDLNALYFAARELRTRSESIARVVRAVGTVDAALAVASYRAGTRGWTRPRFQHAGTRVTLSGIQHPLVEHAVPNGIELAPPYGVLLTGANMSGKSTFLRSVGVSVVLAQTINTCLATAYEAPIFRVRSLIGRADDLIEGKSYYMVEVEAVVALVEIAATGAPHLFLFDEMFRGTNTVERVAAAAATLTELLKSPAGAPPHLVFAATHDGELVQILDGICAPYHFPDALGDEGLVFEYRLQPGPATTRNAIGLLSITGAPDSLVERARELADALDEAGTLRGGSRLRTT